MYLLKIIKHSCSHCLYYLLEACPLAWKKKITIILAIIKNDWRIVRFLGPRSVEFGTIRPEKLDKLFAGLDETSLAEAKKFLAKLQLWPDFAHVTTDTPRHYFSWAGLYSEEELRQGEKDEHEIEVLQKYFYLPVNCGDASSLIHHHGLKLISTELKSYLAGKVFIDAGAYIGDSTLVFLSYSPFQIFAFEPSPSNRNAFVKTMALNLVRSDQVVLVDKALSNRTGTVTFSENTCATTLRESGTCYAELTTLDNFTQNLARPVGLIKADVEGMGLDLLKGAIETVKRDLPILSLCIYHNTEEFIGIYELLTSLDLNYEYKIVSHGLPWQNVELTLLALPRIS